MQQSISMRDVQVNQLGNGDPYFVIGVLDSTGNSDCNLETDANPAVHVKYHNG